MTEPIDTTASRRSARERPFPLRLPFRSDGLASMGAILLGLFVLIAVFGHWLPIGDPEAIDVGARLTRPSGGFLAGTDALGRSELPRLVQGIRTTLLVAGTSVLITVAISTMLGVLAAYFRGVVGEVIIRIADVLFSFPALLLAILLIAIVGPGQKGVVISIALICCPLMIRVVRAAALGVVNRDFIVAARVGGANHVRIIFVHVLPSIAGAAVVQGTYALCVGMLAESGLSFLGLGLQPPAASLGSLVNEGSQYLPVAPWLVLIPGVLLALIIMSVNLVGDGLRDMLDVRGAEVRR
ncbi:ABC transporter permease subunit [Streptomyces sp. SID8361]|uniref:ABC transporter permease n=1 Tax=Streptomyces sp. MnatMP-M27 TaxID=1839768 RepID=UPI00081D6825|nr:ABC transporter permease [Streptomyces sp. MnatMP-M27]MYU10066.1 ABC transporter permease subunit [Streptomyces sp. SID8361]SCF68004.1 peptide/nickel transport system permease protein [Streptomyces sp. MnatMP-M27]